MIHGFGSGGGIGKCAGLYAIDPIIWYGGACCGGGGGGCCEWRWWWATDRYFSQVPKFIILAFNTYWFIICYRSFVDYIQKYREMILMSSVYFWRRIFNILCSTFVHMILLNCIYLVIIYLFFFYTYIVFLLVIFVVQGPLNDAKSMFIKQLV